MLFLLVALHLIPGVVFAFVFWLLAKTLMGNGATAYLALILSIPLCLVPVQLGILLVWSKKVIGAWSLGAALGYPTQADTAAWYLIPLLLVLILLLMPFVTGPLSVWLERYLRPWVPQWLTTESLIRELSMISSTQRWVTFLLALVFSGFVAPIVEELYFRGFLLPKMEALGVVAPIFNALLFATYHFYFPWNVPAIFIGFTPIVYAVWARGNLLISIIVHCMINLLGVLQLIWLTRTQ